MGLLCRKVAYTRRDVTWFVERMDFSRDIDRDEKRGPAVYPSHTLGVQTIGLGR
jgi:hypothetical protein